jgi:Cu(I)/Ag(I) efflux system membrane fusion protein
MNSKTLFLMILIALGAGGGGYWLAQKNLFGDGGETKAVDSASTGEPKALYYRNPMNPAITSPVPAQDDMGMDYIPVYADDGQSDSEPTGTVKIDPVTIQNIGVRTAIAKKRELSHAIHAVGQIDYNEEKLARLHPKVKGWVEKLRVDTTGSSVRKGDILLSIYSPQLVSSQEEYLLALKNLQVLQNSPFDDIRSGAEQLVKSSRERLELLDVPPHQIKELETTHEIKKRIHIHSPFDGIVMKVGIREGQYATPQNELYMLADLDKVWVYVDVYEYELPWLNVNDKASMTVAAVPGKTFEGEVAYIYPYMERKTRTARVRLEFDNRDMKLKPGMFAKVTLHAGRKVDAVVIPAEAIVRSGNREQVFIVREAGKFEPREVRLGLAAEGLVQILDGVEVGEKVVTSSQFLIDSESKLREATAKMMEVLAQKGEAESTVDLDMSDMEMDDMMRDDPPANVQR